MAQSKSGKNLLYYVVGGVVLLGVGFAMTAPSDDAKATSHAVTKRALPAAASDDQITPQDLEVKFDKITTKPVDAFKPLVYHENTSGGANPNDESAVPTEFTGGEGAWGFTGTVDMDGVEYANIDNSKSGEYAQVKRGDHWKKCTIGEVGPDYVVLDGPISSKKLLMPTQDTSTVAAKTAPAASDGTPVLPDLSGAIGAGNADQTDTSAAQGFGGGGRGRGRGRGGRGRFGGGGGGGGGNFVIQGGG
jgi:hypothetical protein